MDKADRNMSHEWKESGHVKELNFGQGILTLDTVKRFQGQKDGALLLEWNVARIPCVAREDFVRMWTEIHNDSVSHSQEKLCLSPVLGSSNEPLQTSPVFGIQSKRVRDYGNVNDTEENSSFASRKSKRIRIDGASSKENIRRNLFDSPSANVPREQKCTASSPILLRNSYSYKRRRRRLQKDTSLRKALNYIENKYTEEDAEFPMPCVKTGALELSPILDKNSYSYKRKRKQRRKRDAENVDKSRISFADSSTNSEALSNKDNNIFCSQRRQMLIKKLENSLANYNSNAFVEEDSKISDESVGPHSSLSKVKLNIEDSPKECMRDAGKIDIESSHENSDSPKETIDINYDTDQAFSDHIEDVDTQDMFPPIRKDKHVSKNSTKCAVFKSTSPHSQSSNKDSDRTFCSIAEQLRRSFPSVHSSQKISQISSQVNQDSRSSQSGIVISTVSSPQKAPVDLPMQLTLIDSAKKRKKPKRGSLVEKLQSAISRQVSFVRIWKHQMKQTMEQNTPVPCVTVYIQNCTTRFNRQFLEGVAVEDPFSLLPRTESNKSLKFLKIMLIPDIVGQIEMNSGGLVQLFSPWETLDHEELVLNVTYIRVVPENERDIQQYNLNVDPIKRSIVKDFDCPCINANKMISACEDRSGKPNVIEKLVTGS